MPGAMVGTEVRFELHHCLGPPGAQSLGTGGWGIRARVEGHGRGENASHWRICVPEALKA